MLTLAIPFQRHRIRRRSHPSAGVLRAIVHADPRRWNVVILVFLATLTVGYLALTNGNATAGYELRVLERKVDALRQETRRLDLQALRTQSLDVLMYRVADLGYVPVARVQYLTSSTGVAVAR